METIMVLPAPEPRLFGLDAAATYIDTTPRTIQRLIARGLLKPVRIAGMRRVFIDRQDLDRLVDTAKTGV
jgi:excisionase family DNA binding protein